jgi:hypothetical protein
MNVLKALRLSAVAGAILALLTLATPTIASANVFYFSYTSSLNATFGFGQFTTGSSENPALVTEVTGTAIYNGISAAITGLSSFGGASNLLYVPAPFVDYDGISISTASLQSVNLGDFNLFFNEGKNWVYASLDEKFDQINFQVTPLTAAVPEASTWAMMILGFLGLGFLGYRRSSGSSNPTFRMA